MADDKKSDKSIEMRLAEIEDKLAKLHITEEEMKAYHKVSNLLGSAAVEPQPETLAAQTAAACTISQCIVNQCIVPRKINRNYARSYSQCIIRGLCECNECSCGPCSGYGYGGGGGGFGNFGM